MNFKKILLLLLFILSGFISATSQSIFEKIEAGLNSVIYATAVDEKRNPIKTSVAFLISNDGLAITSSSLMQNADSLIFHYNNGKPVELNRIVACHHQADLVLLHFKTSKNHNFFTPSKSAYDGNGEILAFVNKTDSKDGLSYGKIEKVQNCIAGGRIASVQLQNGETSDCAPVIDSSGELIGIYRFTESNKTKFLLPVTIIADTAWVSINQTWSKFKKNPDREYLTTHIFLSAIIHIFEKNWVEAANKITLIIKYEPENAYLYGIRAFCRYKYGNSAGGNSDFLQAKTLNPKEHISLYSRAIYYLSENNYQKALADLFDIVEIKPDFAEAFVEIGKIQVNRNEIQKAYASFSHSIKTDSIIAEAWYERGKLLLKHSSNIENALNDLSTAAKLNPGLDGIFSIIGNVKIKQKKYLEAILDLDKALKQNPEDMHALMDRATANYNAGLTSRACADWEQASKKGNLQAVRFLSSYCGK